MIKRIFGNFFCGIWYIKETGFQIYPSKLEEDKHEYEWRTDNKLHPDCAYPYKDGVKLEYDEEV